MKLQQKGEVLNATKSIKSTNLAGVLSSQYFTDESFFNKHGRITAMKLYLRHDIKSFTGYVLKYSKSVPDKNLSLVDLKNQCQTKNCHSNACM